MYLIFNRDNGQIAHLSLSGVLKLAVDGVFDDAAYAALQKMNDGEYTYVGKFVVSKSAGGVTLDDLKAR